jgi:hypothetical protein
MESVTDFLDQRESRFPYVASVSQDYITLILMVLLGLELLDGTFSLRLYEMLSHSSGR